MSIIINSVADWLAMRNQLHNKRIGFVPTMGNLHAGHRSLLARSKAENEMTVLSIFINPTQFNNPNDLAHYPRTASDDIALAKEVGVDVIFMPNYAELYADAYRFKVIESDDSKLLCGKHRPGHFDGVLTVVLKLLLLIAAQRAYFGEKDYQQLLLVKKMCAAFFVQTDIIGCPTIRTAQGLALSSRNNLLSTEQLALATQFANILKSANTATIIKQQLQQLGMQVDYIEEHWGRRFGAVTIGNVRLIDNVALESLLEIKR